MDGTTHIPRPVGLPDWSWRAPGVSLTGINRHGLVMGLLQHLEASIRPGTPAQWTDVDAIREALRLCREQTAEINAGRLEALK